MKVKTGTARAMEAAASATEGYVLGEQTQEHIALFVEGLAESASIGAKCVVEAVAVADSFPAWEKKSPAYKALGKGVIEALKAVGMKEGSAKGYATHFSNIVRCAKLPEVQYSIGKTKDGKDILKSCTGKQFFLKHCGNFTDAYHAAKIIAKQHGLTNGKGRTVSEPKAMSKAEIIDALDKVINAARTNADLAQTGFVETLVTARHIATGTKLSKMKDANRAASIAASLRGIKKGLSRGQKAAATRRANKAKQSRVVEQARITPVRAPVVTVFH